MKVKIKRLSENAVVPKYAHDTDAGLDLVATSRVFDEDGALVYGTGIAVEIPEGYVGLVFPRSSIAKKDLLQSNAVGIIDSGYRGEILVKYKPSMLYVNNHDAIGKDDKDWRGSIETDPKTQSVSAYGLDSQMFGNMPFNETGRAQVMNPFTGEMSKYQTFDMRIYEIGERIAQLVILPFPKIEFEEVEELSKTERGTGGYGSSGK